MESKKNPTVLLGITRVHTSIKGVALQWKDNNGILIAGQSGSGKSQTAAFLLNQYAALGVKLVICDYDAPDGNEETLSERIAHLKHAFYLPPVKTAEDIQRQLGALDREYQARLKDATRTFPILLVIDEVSAFLSYLRDTKQKGEDPINVFARNLLAMRKVNMRSMIIGQEWSSGFATKTMRIIRSAFRVKLLHRLDSANINLVLGTPNTELTRSIAKLRTGQVFYNDRILQIPLVTERMRDTAQTRILLFDYVAPSIHNDTKALIYDNEVLLEKMIRSDMVA